MKLVHDTKNPKHGDRYLATTGEIAQVYVGPPSLLLASDQALVPLIQTGFAYSYDYTIGRYRWTMQRPLCEHRDRFIEKIRRTVQGHGATFGVGIVLGGHAAAPTDAHRRGVWLAHCPIEDLTEAMSVASNQPVLDVAAGLSRECLTWEQPPIKPWTDPEF